MANSDEIITSSTITREDYREVKNNYKNKYDNLYLSILKIGRIFVKQGISYTKLKTILEYEGYDFSNDCIELAVKQWFLDSFHHNAGDRTPKNISELDSHLGCNFIMKGDACLKLIEHESSKRNIRVAWLSIIIALAALLYSMYHDKQGSNTQTLLNTGDTSKRNTSTYKQNETALNNERYFLLSKDSIVNIHYHYHIDSTVDRHKASQ